MGLEELLDGLRKERLYGGPASAWGSALDEAQSAILGPGGKVFINTVEDDIKELTPDERRWLADVIYDRTLTELHAGCLYWDLHGGEIAEQLDPTPRNQELAAYMRERCPDEHPPCQPEPRGDAIDVDWDALMRRPADMNGRRIRTRGWLWSIYESGTYLFSARGVHQGRTNGLRHALHLGRYLGVGDLWGCIAGNMTLEGTFEVKERRLDDWRVVVGTP